VAGDQKAEGRRQSAVVGTLQRLEFLRVRDHAAQHFAHLFISGDQCPVTLWRQILTIARKPDLRFCSFTVGVSHLQTNMFGYCRFPEPLRYVCRNASGRSTNLVGQRVRLFSRKAFRLYEDFHGQLVGQLKHLESLCPRSISPSFLLSAFYLLPSAFCVLLSAY
jgi:hypothetical protein